MPLLPVTTSAWAALKNGLEKSSTRARSPVMVRPAAARSQAFSLSSCPDWTASKSSFLKSGSTPSSSATALARSISKPTVSPLRSNSNGS